MVLLVFLPFFACLLSLNRQIEGGVATENPETHSLLEAKLSLNYEDLYGHLWYKIDKTVILHINSH